MKCPCCTDTPLVMAERQGVEIDYCPACRGIWLDRGELDKLLDRASGVGSLHAAAVHPISPPAQAMPLSPQDDHRRDGWARRDEYKRKKSWLHEIFD